jgi:hypothetical protein
MWVPYIPDEDLRPPVEMVGPLPLRPMHAWRQVIEDTDPVAMLQQLRCEVRPDESRSPVMRMVGLSVCMMYQADLMALFALNIIADTKYC